MDRSVVLNSVETAGFIGNTSSFKIDYIKAVDVKVAGSVTVDAKYEDDDYNQWIGIGLGSGFGVLALIGVCGYAYVKGSSSKVDAGFQDEEEE